MTGATIHMVSNTGSMLTMCSKQTICAEGIGCHLHSTSSSSNSIFFKELVFDQNTPTLLYMDSLPFLNSVIGENEHPSNLNISYSSTYNQ